MGSRGGHVSAAAFTLVGLILAGCGGDRDDPEPPDDPSPSATTPPTAVTAPEFPPDAQTYAEVTVAAWAAPDLLRLAELATEEVHDQIIALPGPPDLSWSFIRCEEDEDAGSSECSFYNADGDLLALTVDHELLGESRATVRMNFGVTEYPNRPLTYVEAFLAAWRDGNEPRMLNLAVPAATEVYLDLLPPPGTEPPSDVDAELDGGGEVVEVLVTIDDERVMTEISTDLLGESQAIRAATLDTA